MRQRLIRLVCLLSLVGLGPRSLLAQRSGSWRIFRASDGLGETACSSVSISPRGNLWIKHGEAEFISVFDGYSFSTLPAPPQGSFRIYESRSGQLWALWREGLMVYNGRQWAPHTVAEIRNEMQSDPLRQVRQIALVPADRDHVLILLSKRLIDYNAGAREVRLIKTAAETGLGRFTDMIEAADGSVWVSGQHGLAKIPGPARQMAPGTLWQEFLLPPEFGMQNLQRPSEDQKGTITTFGFRTSPENERAIIQLDHGHWRIWPVTGEPLAKAWAGVDGTIWAYTINGMLRIEGRRVIRENIWAGQIKDAVCDNQGLFWLATTEGLVRFAPFLWRAPSELAAGHRPIQGIVEQPNGVLWLAMTDGLGRWDGSGWKETGWPRFPGGPFRPDRICRLPNEHLLISGNYLVEFDPGRSAFETLAPPRESNLRLLGPFLDGAVCAELRSAPTRRLERFDGTNWARWLEVDRGLDLGELNFFAELHPGEFWLGGSRGLAVSQEGRFRKFDSGDGFPPEPPVCLLGGPEGRTWCGTAARLLEFDGRKWSVVLGGLDNLHDMIRTSNGSVWVGTDQGLLGFNKRTWLNYGVEDGLPSAAVQTLWADSAGRIWAGTAQGLGLFHPEADLGAPKALVPQLEPAERGSRDVMVRFRAVDKWEQTPAERLLYSYRLDEGGWMPYTNSAFKTFPEIGRGEHRLAAKAMDRNWNESEESETLEFTVILPWYKERRLVAISLLGFGLVLFFAGVAINRHRKLVRSYAEVGRMVAQRTQELERANQELLHSQKMKALGTLAAGIAHDFNNILSIIKGSAQIIETHLDDKEKIRTRIERIKTVVEQGTAVVRAMLGLSRVTGADAPPCQLNGLVDEALKLLADRFPRELEVRFEPSHRLPELACAKEILQQMLVNLILNAVDATSTQGQIILRTGTWTQALTDLVLAPAEGRAYFFVAVEDTGYGIAPDILPRIFEPFFTTKSFSTRRGTGLGLSMVYELAKQMGYGLAVQSQPGRGSIFWIIIPDRAGIVPPLEENAAKPPASPFSSEQ